MYSVRDLEAILEKELLNTKPVMKCVVLLRNSTDLFSREILSSLKRQESAAKVVQDPDRDPTREEDPAVPVEDVEDPADLQAALHPDVEDLADLLAARLDAEDLHLHALEDPRLLPQEAEDPADLVPDLSHATDLLEPTLDPHLPPNLLLEEDLLRDRCRDLRLEEIDLEVHLDLQAQRIEALPEVHLETDLQPRMRTEILSWPIMRRDQEIMLQEETNSSVYSYGTK
jgi:hypothetical protein